MVTLGASGPARVVVLVTALLLLTACGSAGGGVVGEPVEPDPAGPSSGPAPDEPGSATGPATAVELYASATVLEAGGAGPQLCLGGVAMSLPPQCGGPVITNWDWSAVPGEERRGGTIWGSYVVVGTYDGTTFTLTRPATTLEEYAGPPLPREEEVDLTTPCPEPDGGWRVVEADLTTDASLQRAISAAHALAGFADLWVDQSVNDADAERRPEAMNDPRRLVLNVRVVGDPGQAEARLREVWGGALCVTAATRTEAELRRIQQEVTGREDMLWASTARDAVDLGVIHDDGSLQRELDERYGVGVVRVRSALQPYPG